MKNNKLCAGLVGCGTIAPVHLAALKDLGVEVVALCDVKAERAEKLKTAYAENARLFTDYTTMLQEVPEIDVVHVCTPHFLHVPMAKEALAAGKHVFLEKPVGISEDDARALDAALRAAFRASRWITNCSLNRLHRVRLFSLQKGFL